MLEVILLISNGIVFCATTAATFRLTGRLNEARPPRYNSEIGIEVDLPSVTVCIPARNEAHALIDCLDKVIASSYQRLEIIVLDDVSGDDTSALIKSYASEGVRFVQGAPLEEGWLGKNHALQGLLQEASGTYILYVDVDTRLESFAVERMVRYAVSQRAAMVSVLPRREDGWRPSIFFSPLRYFWEVIATGRRWPATSSSAWLIRRDVLAQKFYGFTGLKAAVQPEAKIAAELTKDGSYRLLVSSEHFGVNYEKKWRSQLLTSVRLLFPLLGGRWLLSLGAIAGLLVAILPFITMFILVPLGMASVASLVIAILAAVAGGIMYGCYTHRVWRHGWLFGALLWPLLVVQEIILIAASMFQYRRKTVRWKGRLIRPEVQS